MFISGLQKMTLLDYPGKIACTVFLQGCNFHCPFCHNSDLLGRSERPFMEKDEFLSFLKGRVGLLDAVCVSGGEPTLQPDLPELLREIKALGYKVKLDTNGNRPEILRQLVEETLVDYVAMDIKNSPARYGETVGISGFSMEKVEESIRYLLSGQVDYEFRTTVVAQLHDESSIEEMGQYLFGLAAPEKPQMLFLQPFVNRDSVLLPGLTPPEPETMEKYAQILAPYIEKISIRGQ